MERNFRKVKIDRDATLWRFTEAGIAVRSWCKTRGFSHVRFYDVINNRTFKYRTCRRALMILDALRKEGLLVEETVHADSDTPSTATNKLEQAGGVL